VRDVVLHGENGYLAGVEDVDGFRRALIHATESSGRYRQMSERSLELSRTYTWSAVERRFSGLYAAARAERLHG
jgi:glycosyltransferase involved in cell wall biosynthesis